MKKVAILLATFLVLAVPVIAQEAADTSASKLQMHSIGVLGKGLAVDASDPMEFKIVKFALATVRTNDSDESTEIRVGILYLDDYKYRIKDFVIEDGKSTGDIYDNGTKTGSYELTSVEKNNGIIWAGTLSVSGTSYNVYVIEGKREIKGNELASKTREYCQENPERCKGIISNGIGNIGCDDPTVQGCSEKIRNFCENNPDDSRCKNLFRSYCANNLNDTRCRAALNDYCENNTDSEACRSYRLKVTADYCVRRPTDDRCVQLQRERLNEYCLENPDDAKCVAVKTTAEFMSRVQLVKDCYTNPETDKCEQFCENNPVICKREQISARIMEDVSGKIKAAVQPRIREMTTNSGGNQ